MKIFYDVDTQHDFMDRTGALYVPGAEEIKPNLERLTHYAGRRGILVAGSVDKHFGTEEYKHREGELKSNGGPFQDHCMAGSAGQGKIKETRSFGYYPIALMYVPVETNIYIPHRIDDKVDNKKLGEDIKTTAERSADFRGGLFFEKQSYDVFTNPAISEFLKIADVKEAVVYGLATDYCLKAAVIGMQKQGIQCYVVKDAIAAVTPETGKSALEEMMNAGAKFVKTDDVINAAKR